MIIHKIGAVFLTIICWARLPVITVI